MYIVLIFLTLTERIVLNYKKIQINEQEKSCSTKLQSTTLKVNKHFNIS